MEQSQAHTPSTMIALIVGGGIGGLATAIACQRHGIRALVFERAQQFCERGTGLILAGNAVKALNKLDLADVLRASAAPLRFSYLRSWRGDVLAELPMQEVARRYGAYAVAVHRAELQAALVSALDAHGV